MHMLPRYYGVRRGRLRPSCGLLVGTEDDDSDDDEQDDSPQLECHRDRQQARLSLVDLSEPFEDFEAEGR